MRMTAPEFLDGQARRLRFDGTGIMQWDDIELVGIQRDSSIAEGYGGIVFAV
jgi:hypothetical protein